MKTAFEILDRFRVKVVCAVIAGSLVVMWAWTIATPRVSMTVRALTARNWPRVGHGKSLIATIELTNASDRAITYWGVFDPNQAAYSVLHKTSTGWKGPSSIGIQPYTLAPARAMMFEAIISRDIPCKIALTYSDGRTPSRFWQALPRWLTQRLPWAGGTNTVITDRIDPHDAAGQALQRQVPFMKPREATQDVLAAAQRGDADAQFTLAGRYLTGSRIERSRTEALRWYEAAATNGHAEAAYNLGAIYEYGLGTASNQARAIEWYQRSSALGHAGAQARLRAMAAK